MNQLQTQQDTLLNALFSWPAENATRQLTAYLNPGAGPVLRGIQAYQSNGHALAQRALAAAYPVVQQLIGAESFADLARALWHAHPPVRGDLALWGDTLAAFVAHSPQLQDVPYLADVARAEWCLHTCATAADATLQLDTLQLLTTHDPDRVTLELTPGSCVISSRWPLASLLRAHREESPSMAQVGAAIRSGAAEDVVVWRQGWQPALRQAQPGEAAVVQALVHGATLAQALDAGPTLDFSQWLPLAVQSGLLLAVRSVTPDVSDRSDTPTHDRGPQ